MTPCTMRHGQTHAKETIIVTTTTDWHKYACLLGMLQVTKPVLD